MFPIIFVSLGPGDPELITVKGLKALQHADCIFCPETCGRDGNIGSRAADILLRLEIPTTVIRRFLLPMKKQREKAQEVYEQVYVQAVAAQQTNQRVCIVAEGDAGFYSSIHYILEKLYAAGLPVEHIAGVPAFIAAGALGRLHIVSQEERLIVIPGLITVGEIEKNVSGGNVVVIMKLSQCANEVRCCIRLHPEYSYHYFENVGTSGEQYINDARQIEMLQFPYFSLLVVRCD